MNRIVFKVMIWDEVVEVELDEPSGAGGGWHFSLNRFHQAQIIRRQGVWGVYYQKTPPWWMTKAELDVLAEMVEEAVNRAGLPGTF